MTNELSNNKEIKIQIINSLNQSKEKWFELLKESFDNEELRAEIMSKINDIDEKIIELNENLNIMLLEQYDRLTERLKEVEKQIKIVHKSKNA